MGGNDCEIFILKEDMVKGMGGKSDYEKMVMAAAVHDVGKFWRGQFIYVGGN